MFKPCLSALVLSLFAAVESVGAVSPEQPVAEAVHRLVEEAKALLAQDENDSARNAFLEARSLIGDHPDSVTEFTILAGLADIDLKEGKYAAAGQRLDEAERLWREDPDPARGVQLWTARAGVSYRQFRKGEALQFRLRATEQARQTRDQALMFQALTNLARAYLDLHDHAAAIPVFAETARLDGRPLDRVVNQIQLGISQFELNQFEAARETFTAARAAASELESPRLEGVASGELGLIAWKGDENGETALAYFDQAIDLLRDIGDRINVAVWQSNKASIFRESGDFKAALDLYLALEIELQSIEGQRVWPAIYKGMGQSQIELGRLDEAAASIDKCLVAAGQQGDRKRIWECRQLLGRLLGRIGRFEEAREAYEAALEEIERIRVSLLVGRFKADFFEDKLGVFQEYAAFLADNFPADRAAIATFQVAERARARSFLDEFAHSKITVSAMDADSYLSREEELLEQIRNLRTGLADKPENAVKISQLESELDQLALVVGLESGRPLESTRPRPLEEIQSALAADQHMLAYWLAEPYSFAWRIDARSIEYFKLPPGREIEAMVRGGYGNLTNPHSTPDLTALSNSLLGPILDSSTVASSLLIVPSGILHFLPFEALPVSKGTVLADHASTSYLPSASLAAIYSDRVRLDKVPELLAVGAVSYQGQGEAARGLDPERFAPLPYSGDEIRAVRGAFGRFSTTLLRGEGARESNLKSVRFDRFSVLHFATHGWIDAGSQTASGLVLAPGDDNEDGLWQSREIRQVSLDAELVTLSACQSGLGKLVTGEGMVGLTRAFLDAGARTVVASLWNVNDQATAEFMSLFYSRLAQGIGRAEALRLARIDLRRDPGYSHPYYWAGWVLTGEGQRRVAFPPRWDDWLLITAALSLGLGIILALRRHSPS